MPDSRWRRDRYDDIGCELYEIGGELVEDLGRALAKAVFDHEVLALDIPQVVQAFFESVQQVGDTCRGQIAEAPCLARGRLSSGRLDSPT